MMKFFNDYNNFKLYEYSLESELELEIPKSLYIDNLENLVEKG